MQLALVDQRGTNLSRSQHQQTISEGTIRCRGVQQPLFLAICIFNQMIRTEKCS